MTPQKRMRDKRRKMVADLKVARGCRECGYNQHPEALHFHHRDPATKEFQIARAIGQATAMHKILAEIDKCDILCANCHAIQDKEF